MNWSGPILTDSGGFQVWSLGELRKISEQGVVFRSPVNGDRVELTPERSMAVQRHLGSDVVMVFDECTPYPASEAEASASMQLSLRWAQRCRDSYGQSDAQVDPGLLFGIVQGGMYDGLRRESLDGLLAQGFDGYAIGGLSVGESKAEMDQVLRGLLPHMPAGRPRYLMGVGTPADLVRGVALGVDMFDCVMPTRNARNGYAFTSRGHAEDSQRPASACSGTAGPGVRLLHLSELLPGLPASPRSLRRDARQHADDRAQSVLLPCADGSFARLYRNGYISHPHRDPANRLELPK